jgi:hypothetical protein
VTFLVFFPSFCHCNYYIVQKWPQINQESAAKQAQPKTYQSLMEYLRNCRIAEANAAEQLPPAHPQIRPAMAHQMNRGQNNEQMRMLNLRDEDREILLQRRFAAYAPNHRQIPMVLVPNPNYAPQQPLISKYLTNNITDTDMCSPKVSSHWQKRILVLLNQTKKTLKSQDQEPSEQHKETKTSRKRDLKFPFAQQFRPNTQQADQSGRVPPIFDTTTNPSSLPLGTIGCSSLHKWTLLLVKQTVGHTPHT